MASKKAFKAGAFVQIPKNFNMPQYRGWLARVVCVEFDTVTLRVVNGTVFECRADDLSQKRVLGAKERFEILERDGFRCQLCGRDASHGVRLEIDHKTPYSKGGETFADNLWTLCHECNAGKSAKQLKMD